jgi:hypothetical protein
MILMLSQMNPAHKFPPCFLKIHYNIIFSILFPNIFVQKSLLLINVSLLITVHDASEVAPCTKLYPKVTGRSASSEGCIWYSPLPLGAVISLFYMSV